MAILGNSFEVYERYVDEKRWLNGSVRVEEKGKRVIGSRRFVREVRVEGCEEGDDGLFRAFHDISWHFFDVDKDTEMNLINDVGYIDSHSIVVTTYGGMVLFSSSTGDARHRFEVSHENQFKTFAARALTFSNQESKIFASCRGNPLVAQSDRGIGVWDQITGNQSDFFYEPPSCSLGNADKLQWLDGKNCLMVATLFPTADRILGLLDFREKGVVWSWSDKGTMLSNLKDKRVLHAIAMEDNHTICVVNQYDDLGFLDIRNNGHSVRWRSSRGKLIKRMVMEKEWWYPKLVTNNGQLFSSMNDSTSVFCGPEWVLTSNLRRNYGGSIRDFSVGGDRLFALHGEENVFDVWETLPSPMN